MVRASAIEHVLSVYLPVHDDKSSMYDVRQISVYDFGVAFRSAISVYDIDVRFMHTICMYNLRVRFLCRI